MTAENRRILIIDDERPILLTLEALLGRHGYQPETAATASYGLRVLQNNPPAVVLLDLQLPDADGLQMLEQIKRDHPDLPAVMISGHGNIETAVAAIKRGAYDFLEKPFKSDRLIRVATQAIAKSSTSNETKIEAATGN